MDDFNPNDIFTLPLILQSNCTDSTDCDNVKGLQVKLTNGNSVLSKTLLLYQDTSILNSQNGQGQPVVQFLCEVDDNNDDQSTDSSENVQSCSSLDTSSKTINLTDETLCFTNGMNGSIERDQDSQEGMRYEMREQESEVEMSSEGAKACDVDILNSSLDSFIETVVQFQCRLCQHASNEKSDVVRHLKSFHLINNTQKEEMLLIEEDKDIVEDNCIKKEKMDDEKSDKTQTVYMCGQCSLPFETIAECKSHMANHPKSKGGNKVSAKAPKKDSQQKIVYITIKDEIDCNKASSTTTNNEDKLTEDETEKESELCPDLLKEKNIKCEAESCDLKFSTEEYMKRHAETHSSPGADTPYNCTRCHYMFSRWPEVALHMWKSHHIDLDLYKCLVCPFKSVSRVALRRHFQNHALGDFYCSVCGKSFMTEERLTSHSSTHANIETNTKQTNTLSKKKNKVEKCGECGMLLSSAKALKKHVTVVHGKLRPYVCQVCPFTTSTLATLTLHLRQHTGETPFNCDHCTFKTRDHNTMRRHRMRHTFLKPYMCKHCEFSSVQSTALKNHILKFHPGSPNVFECSDCPFTTLKETLMNTHKTIHHSDGRPNKLSDEVNRDRNLSSMFPSSKSKDKNSEDKQSMEVEDEESSSQCYFDSEHIDTGGITIPAEESKTEDKCSPDVGINDGGGIHTIGGVLVPNEDTMPLS